MWLAVLLWDTLTQIMRRPPDQVLKCRVPSLIAYDMAGRGLPLLPTTTKGCALSVTFTFSPNMPSICPFLFRNSVLRFLEMKSLPL